MDILALSKNDWHKTLISALVDFNVECHFFCDGHFSILSLKDYQFAIHLVSIQNNLKPNDLVSLQEIYRKKNVNLVHLWEDVWLTRSKQVIFRIKSLIGLNLKIHGRKTLIQKIDKPTADLFLNKNHLQGAVSSRYKLGLFEKDELIAVATFSALRKMNHTENYRSAELIRFAVKAGYSISGGLSKLLKHFIRQYHPQDIMTYADKDWSNGKAYEKLGFVLTDTLSPQWFSLDKFCRRALKKDTGSVDVEVFNTGSIKFILTI